MPMRAFLLPFALLCAAPIAAQERLDLPSGLAVQLVEVLWDAEVETGRFRLHAPEIAEDGFDAAVLADDFMVFCREFALPVQRALRPEWDELVVSVASEPRPFGQSDASVVQFFEGFVIDGRDCIWSDF